MNDPVQVVASEWMHKAANDLLNARHTLTLGDDAPLDTVCFHAQQCVEKCLKALLVLENQPVPKLHDIRLLASRISDTLLPQLNDDEMDILTDYATVTRYPGIYEPISTADARYACDLADRVMESVKSRIETK